MTNTAVPFLQQEYEHQKQLFESQPVIVQRFLEGQAQFVADALITKKSHVQFSFPDHVTAKPSRANKVQMFTIPAAQRHIKVGGFVHRDVRDLLIQRLNELEKSVDQAIGASAGLLRYATA